MSINNGIRHVPEAGAQDLFERLGDVLSFVTRKSEHGEKEGRDSILDITLTFRIKHFV